MEAKNSNLGSLQVVNGQDFTPPPGDPNPTPTPNPVPTPTPTPPMCPSDNGDVSDDDSSTDHEHHAHHKASDGKEMCDDQSSDDRSGDDCEDHNGKESGSREYICGVNGPGKSDRIGITENEQLTPEHDSHQGKKLVCMSQHACETLARKAFPESHTIRYGWCKTDSNKNVKHISDEHMKALIDKFISDNP